MTQLFLHGVNRIVTGGQTGVDRAAMDVAMELGVPLGGWCPRGRLAEDGPIDPRYPLEECDSPDYKVRTEWNVRDSNGTLILYRERLQGGTWLTYRLAQQYAKPVCRVRLDRPAEISSVANWLHQQGIEILNVAGPRGSSHPEIYEMARQYLERLLTTQCLLCTSGQQRSAPSR